MPEFKQEGVEICAAFVEARKHLKNPHRNAESHNNRYAKLEDIVKLVNPILVEHGLTFMQGVRHSDGSLQVVTTLIHSSGQTLSETGPPMPLGGVKQTPQSVGSATTYAKRYGLLAILGVEQTKDDDGAEAMKAFADDLEGVEPEPAPEPTPEPTIKQPEAKPKLTEGQLANMAKKIESGERTLQNAHTVLQKFEVSYEQLEVLTKAEGSRLQAGVVAA